MAKHTKVTFPDKKMALDMCLAALKAKGCRVVDYWREGGQWVFKLMVRA